MESRDEPNLILAYVEGELPEADVQRFEERCRQDESLAALVHDLKADRKALRGLPRAAPPKEGSLIDAAVGQLERSLLLGEDSDLVSPLQVGSGASSGLYRILRYVSYIGIAAALGLTAIILVDNLTGTPLEQRGRELAVVSSTTITGDRTKHPEDFLLADAGADEAESEAFIDDATAESRSTMSDATKSDAPDVSTASVRVMREVAQEMDTETDALDRDEIDPNTSATGVGAIAIQGRLQRLARPETQSEQPASIATANAAMGLQATESAAAIASVPAAELPRPLLLESELGRLDSATHDTVASLATHNALTSHEAPQPRSVVVQRSGQTFYLVDSVMSLGRQSTQARTPTRTNPKVLKTSPPAAPTFTAHCQVPIDPSRWLDPAYWLHTPIRPSLPVSKTPQE
ncbi:MAG: hypothetical protein AAF086_07405 [Planctomycetota bacterium]